MRNKFQRLLVPVNEIGLDLNNLRYFSFNTQKECLEYMLRDKDTKLQNILKDIVQSGLSLNPILISKSNDTQYKYTVRDGNRRIAVVKTLLFPELLPKDIKFGLKVDDEILKELDPIECYYTDDEEIINWHIERSHSGEMGGVSTNPWSPVAQYNSAHRQGKIHYLDDAMALVEYLRKKDIIIALSDLENITNIQRLAEDRDAMALAGISYNNKKEVQVEDDKAAIPIISCIINDFSTNKRFTVRDIETKSERENYMRLVLDKLGITHNASDAPVSGTPASEATDTSDIVIGNKPASGARNTSGSGTSGTPASEATNTSNIGVGGKSASGTRNTSGRGTGKARKTDRNKLFGRGTGVSQPTPDNTKSAGNKACAILEELGRMDVTKTPIATGILLRLLFETGANYYNELTSLSVPKQWDNKKLYEKITMIATRLEQNGIIDRGYLEICKKIEDSSALFSINTLNHIVHRDAMIPLPSEIVGMYDRYETLIKAMFT